jgi:hypothetical protein
MSNEIKRSATITDKISFHIEFQVNDNSCGPACIIMVLSWFGVDIPDQVTLISEIESYHSIDDDRWYASPDAIRSKLNKVKPKKYRGRFRIYAEKKQFNINARVVWSIFSFGTPCIVLTGVGHWIVVYGYTPLHLTPRNASDNSLVISGFYIRDPLRTHEQGHIPYSQWLREIKEQVRGGHWKHRFIAICDPDKNKKMRKKSGSEKKDISEKWTTKNTLPMRVRTVPFKNQLNDPMYGNMRPEILNKISPPIMIKTKNPVNNKPIINKKSAGEYAIWALHNEDFYNPTMLQLIMKNPRAARPFLVRQLDENDFFYLVPIVEDNGKIYAILSIDAEKEAYRRSTYSTNIEEPIEFRPLTRVGIKNILLKGHHSDLREIGKMKIEETLVWKRCEQSFSPFLPFHQITIGRKIWYVRIDGKLFKRLLKD